MKQPREDEDGFTPATRHSLEAIVSSAARGTIERYLNALRTNSRKDRTLELAALHLRGLANEVSKPLAKVSRQDLERYLSRMKNEKTGKTAGRATLELRRGTIKQFYRWLLGDSKKPKEFPENVAWIRTHRTPKERLAEDMLAKDEVRGMIEAANGTRDKALVGTLYETGTRIGEFLSLRIRDIRIKDGGYAIVSLPAESSSLKTGRRQIPIVESLPYLMLWLEAHPSKEDQSAFLWPSEYGERRDRQIDDTTVLKLVRRLAVRAKVDKDVTPHLFRHSRATECARRGWNESQMRRYFGWSRSSTMPSLYTHLAAGDVEARILEDNGLKARPDPIADPLAPLVCGRCGRRNPATVVYCLSCAAIVSVEKALEIERQADTEGRVQAEYLANPAKFQELLNKPEVKIALRILGDAAKIQTSPPRS